MESVRKYQIKFVQTSYGRVWSLRCAGGAKTPLLVIHGGPGFPHNYLEKLKQLSDERDVIFYDQLGCGNSERPLNDNFRNLEYFIGEVNDVIKAFDLNEVILLGHSWGACLACEYAAISKNSVKGIIFSSPFLDTKIWMQGAQQNINSLNSKVQNIIKHHEKEKTTFSDEYTTAIQEYDKKFGVRIRPLPPEVDAANRGFDAETYNKLWGPSEFNPIGELKNYSSPIDKLPQVPVLFTCGHYDSAKEQFLLPLKENIPGSKIVVFEKSSHMPHLEQPAEYINVLKEFFQENNI